MTGWATSRFLVTTHRVIRRSGLIARRSVEIPLERIANVRFHETLLDRLVGAGDLRIESPGTLGGLVFDDIPKPERVQRLIVERCEANLVRARVAVARAQGPSSVADELLKLNRLRQDGVLTDD